MSRLTKCKGDYCFMYNCENEEGTIGEECSLYNICYGRKIYNKLCRYEDLEEQGRLIETIRCKDCGYFTLDYDGHLGYCKYWDNYNSHLGYCSGAKLAEVKGTEE